MPLEFHSLCKNYGRTQALKDFSITLDNGIYALLGPNGAGKSTLINILAGLLDATSGHITFDGEDTLAMGACFRSLIGFMPQYPGFYPDFTAEHPEEDENDIEAKIAEADAALKLPLLRLTP